MRLCRDMVHELEESSSNLAQLLLTMCKQDLVHLLDEGYPSHCYINLVRKRDFTKDEHRYVLRWKRDLLRFKTDCDLVGVPILSTDYIECVPYFGSFTPIFVNIEHDVQNDCEELKMLFIY